jgi:hypothetical protein
MIEFSRAIWPNQTELASVFDVAATKAGDSIRLGKPAGDLVQAIPEERRPHVFRALAWLVKLGVFRLVTQGLNQEQHSGARLRDSRNHDLDSDFVADMQVSTNI